MTSATHSIRVNDLQEDTWKLLAKAHITLSTKPQVTTHLKGVMVFSVCLLSLISHMKEAFVFIYPHNTAGIDSRKFRSQE